MSFPCAEHSGVMATIKGMKWLFGILVACLLGLFAFQGAILTQIYEVKSAQAVMSTKIDGLQKQVNGDYRRSKEVGQ